jgi:predicted phosphate transport protein (TIGR00153 family)
VVQSPVRAPWHCPNDQILAKAGLARRLDAQFGYSGLFIVMNLLPKDDKFFELFEKHSAILCRASSLLLTGLAEGYEGVCRIEKEMNRIEDDGDHVIHEIFRRLRSTFITPFDPEDIQALATSLDDVLDGIEDVTFRIVAYQLNPIPDSVTLLAEKIHGSCGFLAKALDALHRNKPVIDFCIEVNRLENDADHIERNQIAELFRTERDAIELIRQKEIVELLEATTDRCEDAADVMQNVAVKHS